MIIDHESATLDEIEQVLGIPVEPLPVHARPRVVEGYVREGELERLDDLVDQTFTDFWPGS